MKKYIDKADQIRAILSYFFIGQDEWGKAHLASGKGTDDYIYEDIFNVTEEEILDYVREYGWDDRVIKHLDTKPTDPEEVSWNWRFFILPLKDGIWTCGRRFDTERSLPFNYWEFHSQEDMQRHIVQDLINEQKLLWEPLNSTCCYNNLRYCYTDGFEEFLDPSQIDNSLTDQANITLLKRDIKNRKIKWNWGIDREFCPNYGWATLVPDSSLLIVIVGSEDLPLPNNGLVLNCDGTTNHKLIVPKYVEINTKLIISKFYLVEEIIAAVQINGRIAIDLKCKEDWIERRYYDAKKQEWQERDSIYQL